MLEKLLKPFTTATGGGTIFRDVFIMIGTVIGLLGAIGVLTPEQAAELNKTVETLSGQWPALVAAIGAVMAAGMSIYRAIFMSSSNKAHEAAKEIDEKLPAKADVVIQTPGNQPDIVVPAKP
jgi:hypothetical protein